MPTDLDQVKLKLLGKLSAADLTRLGIPSSAAFTYLYQTSNPSIAAFAGAGLAAGIGASWAFWKPYGRAIDQNLYHGIRWSIQNRTGVETPSTEDGVIQTENSAAALIEVDPVNIDLKSGGEKAALHRLYQELLQSVDYPVTVYSTQQVLRFAEHFENLKDRDDIGESYRKHCQELLDDSNSQSRHYLEIRVENGDRSELSNRVSEILEHLTSGGLKSYRVTELDRSLIDEDPELNPHHIQHSNSEQKKFSKTLYVSDYPREVDFSWITQILQIEGLVDVTQSFNPEHSADIVSKLQKLENKAGVENQSLVRKGYGRSRKLERLLDDIDWFQKLLADQNDQPVEYGCYITAYGETVEECESVQRKIENRLKTLGISYCSTSLRTDQAYYSNTPGLPDKLDEQCLMPSGSAAAGFPFNQEATVDESGVLFGVDHSTESPVILDRYKWNAGHSVFSGVTGSGKSFYSKLLLLRSAIIYDNLNINIVDPKPEYGEIEGFLEDYSSVQRFGTEGDIKDDTEQLIEAVVAAYENAQNTEEKTIVVIDEAHRLLKTKEGASVLSTLVREARSSNTAVTLITQTVADFYRTEDGEDILKNIPCKVLFAHEKADDAPAEAFQLSNVAETQLYNLTKGDQDSSDYSEAILSVSNEFESKIKVQASTVEASIIENGEISEPDLSSSGSYDIDYKDDIDSTDSDLFDKIQHSIEEYVHQVQQFSLPKLKTPDLSAITAPDIGLHQVCEKTKTRLTNLSSGREIVSNIPVSNVKNTWVKPTATFSAILGLHLVFVKGWNVLVTDLMSLIQLTAVPELLLRFSVPSSIPLMILFMIYVEE
jgi:hypothetical protein